MKKIVSFAILFFIITTIEGFGCDTGDPICVASIVFEKGASLRYNELTAYYCEQNEIFLNEAIRRSENMVAERKKKGIDYYKQVKNDFSRLKYDLLENHNGKAAVRVSGVLAYDLEGTDFHHEANVEQTIELIKDRSSWLFCSEELARRSQKLNSR
jgi:hypothetical protein